MKWAMACVKIFEKIIFFNRALGTQPFNALWLSVWVPKKKQKNNSNSWFRFWNKWLNWWKQNFLPSKSLDTVSNGILIAKLLYYAISKSTLKWFQSYLSGDRKQYVCNKKKKTIPNYLPICLKGSHKGQYSDLNYFSFICSICYYMLMTGIFYGIMDKITQFNSILNKEIVKLDDWFQVEKHSKNYSMTGFGRKAWW